MSAARPPSNPRESLPPPRRANITIMDFDRVRGHYVRIVRNGQEWSKFFAGLTRESFAAAKSWRDEMLRTLGRKAHNPPAFHRRNRANRTTGITGVSEDAKRQRFHVSLADRHASLSYGDERERRAVLAEAVALRRQWEAAALESKHLEEEVMPGT